MDNFMSLKVKSLSRNEAFVRSAVAAFATELNPTIDAIEDLKTAVSEAVTNCVVHAYADNADGIITINAQIRDNAVHIEVIDNGCGIPDIVQARKAFYTTRPEEERSGMGFTVMETFMDTLEVLPNLPHGTVVRMTKHFVNDDRKAAD